MNESSMDSELSSTLTAIVVLSVPVPDDSAPPTSRVGGPISGPNVERLDALREAWHVMPDGDLSSRLSALRSIIILAIDREVEQLTWQFSGVTLDRQQMIEALGVWTATRIPVHALVGFDFAVPNDRSDVAGVASLGLGAIVGQEIAGYPRLEAQRRNAARIVARLAHDLLTNGPMRQTGWFDGPDYAAQQVRLVPDRDGRRLSVIF